MNFDDISKVSSWIWGVIVAAFAIITGYTTYVLKIKTFTDKVKQNELRIEALEKRADKIEGTIRDNQNAIYSKIDSIRNAVYETAKEKNEVDESFRKEMLENIDSVKASVKSIESKSQLYEYKRQMTHSLLSEVKKELKIKDKDDKELLSRVAFLEGKM